MSTNNYHQPSNITILLHKCSSVGMNLANLPCNSGDRPSSLSMSCPGASYQTTRFGPSMLLRSCVQRVDRLVLQHAGCQKRRLYWPGWSSPAVSHGPRYAAGPPQGLRYWPNFVTEAEGRELTRVLDAGDWLEHLQCRAQQFFGLVYYQGQPPKPTRRGPNLTQPATTA